MSGVALEEATCYICHVSDGALWAEENGFRMIKCAGCGLVYLNPRPSLAEIDEAATTGLHKFGAGALNAIGSHSPRKVREYTAKLRALLPESAWGDPVLSWLDIGAGFGELVEAVRDLGGAAVRGIEPCVPKVDRAKGLGLPVDTTPLSDLTGPYTHVSLINVYSHVPDPVAFLGDLRRVMAPRGTLVLVTGNGGDVDRREFPGSLYLPDHLSFAGEGNLRTVLDRAGYEVESIDAYAAIPSFDNPLVAAIKNVARVATGRPAVPLSFPRDSRFRSLWIRAVARD